MRIKPIPVSCWRNFLISKGCTYARDKASHEHWKCPNCLRTITFWGSKKEVPGFHIETNLRTMGIPNEEFMQWVNQNC